MRPAAPVFVRITSDCSGPRLGATTAFAKKIKLFSTYLRYRFLLTIILIIFFCFDFSGISRSDKSCYCKSATIGTPELL